MGATREVDKLAFEVFDKRKAPLGKTPGVTIQKKGLFSLNRAAAALMGDPSAVIFLYDRAEQVVGLRPVAADDPHGYPLRPQGKGDSGPLIAAGTLFAQHYDLDVSVARRWVPTWEDGILRVDLKTPGTVVTSNRTARSRSTASGSATVTPAERPGMTLDEGP